MVPKVALVLRGKSFQNLSLDHQDHWSSNIFMQKDYGTQIYKIKEEKR